MIPPCHAHHSVPSKSAWLHLLGRYTVESEVPENDELDLFINQTVGSRVSWEGGEAGVGGGGMLRGRQGMVEVRHKRSGFCATGMDA